MYKGRPDFQDHLFPLNDISIAFEYIANIDYFDKLSR